MKQTPEMMPVLQQACERMGYAFFINGQYNLNLIGVRKDDTRSNEFKDDFYMIFRDNNDLFQCYCLKCSTTPGLYYRKHPMNPKGTAILKKGQYRGGWRIGLHHGYRALVQAIPLPLWRDNDHDEIVDIGENLSMDMAGINIHRATNILGKTSTYVDKWSAGCQVIASYKDFEFLMSIVDKSAAKYGDRFTYTLFDESDLLL